MLSISPLTVGFACLAIGVLAGYSIPRPTTPRTQGEQTIGGPEAIEPEKISVRPPAPARPKPKYAFKFPEGEAAPKQKPAAASAPSLLAATDHKTRMEGLQKLATADLPRLVTELCQTAGPRGISERANVHPRGRY